MPDRPMAASVAVIGLLAGPPRRVDIAVTTPHAVYLTTGDAGCPVLCLADREAVRVPFALVVASPLAVSGAAGWVGDGTLALPGFTGTVGRWWRPPRPRGLTAARLATIVAELPAPVPEMPDPAAAAAHDELVDDLTAGRPPETALGRLLGRGPGLTPYWDDVVAGLLVTLGALGTPAFDRLGAAVCRLAPERTTLVSAALLRHAARAECVPELDAVLTGDGPLEDLLGVGGSSGAGLAHGILAAHAVAARAGVP
jgi:hypothetical protein